jgi:protein SMG8
MVAAAAAAAAASASGGASGATKPLHNPPDLPTVTAWFSASQILVEALTSAWENRDNIKADSAISEKNDNLKVQNSSPRKGVRRYSQTSLGVPNVNPTGGTSNLSMVSQQRVASLHGVVSTLDSTVDIDHKFSTAWCKRSIPLALEVYLKDLPSTYPTVVHIAHLERALVVFHNMVRGPAVPLFVGKLTASCEAIWHAGRQLCDAVSLTGKPCRHLVHNGVEPISHPMTDVCRTGGQAEIRAQKGDMKGKILNLTTDGVSLLESLFCIMDSAFHEHLVSSS